ncbi:MAG TPA: LuxR C-terminal-related transcriptional regulator [Moraxellaceae bacterium]|nr:LuxR C-terminal-related transcriptional regulator [Moraxellaceae bacterium]
MTSKETLSAPLFVELSRRETEVLVCISKGLRVSDTARHLGLADSTVASYIKNLYRKLHISSRAEAAVEAVRRGLI